MNANTGEIREFNPDEFKNLFDEWIGVNREDMTEKQEQEKKVSLKDHRSILGKKLTGSRRERRQAARNAKKDEQK